MRNRSASVTRDPDYLRTLPGIELHQLEHRAAEQAIRIAERLLDLEVVVAAADNVSDRLAGALHGVGEVAVLALKLRRLERAVRHDYRRHQLVEMPQR